MTAVLADPPRGTSGSAREPRETRTRVALVGTFPPTACGLATFTASLRSAIASVSPAVEAGVIRMVATGEATTPSPHVVAEWTMGDPVSRQLALGRLDDFDVVVVQHEYGIFGGPDGAEIVDFLRRSPVPSVVVLHTVLDKPTHQQRSVLGDVLDAAGLVVVQSEVARLRLVDGFPAIARNVVVVPHGAWTTPFGPRRLASASPVVLTWGLLGPGKGLEHGIDAMAHLSDLAPAPTYLIVGRTHPKVADREGESYRDWLVELARARGVADRVNFEDDYLGATEMQAMVRSADVVLLPYDSTDQVTSGVLVEAIAAGIPVVSTAFPHAVEALQHGNGLVVRHGDPAGIARALRTILTRRDVAESMRAKAVEQGKLLWWPTVARTYFDLIDELVARQVAA